VLFAGLALVLRDVLQRLAGVRIAIIAVVIGSILSYLWVNPALAVAGCSAYFLSEMADTLVYSWLQRYQIVVAVLISACTGLVIDTVVFLQLAFHSYQFMLGQIIGKLWMVILALPLLHLSRKYLSIYQSYS
jgi:hypothetical protein